MLVTPRSPRVALPIWKNEGEVGGDFRGFGPGKLRQPAAAKVGQQRGSEVKIAVRSDVGSHAPGENIERRAGGELALIELSLRDRDG